MNDMKKESGVRKTRSPLHPKMYCFIFLIKHIILFLMHYSIERQIIGWKKIFVSRTVSVFLSATPEPLYCFLASKYLPSSFDMYTFFTDAHSLFTERTKLKSSLYEPHLKCEVSFLKIMRERT